MNKNRSFSQSQQQYFVRINEINEKLKKILKHERELGNVESPQQICVTRFCSMEQKTGTLGKIWF